MKHRESWRTIWRTLLRTRPVWISIAAVMLIILQQIYYPEASATVVLNIILLGLNLLIFVPLLQRDANTSEHPEGAGNHVPQWAGLSFVSLLSFLYNVLICGVPSPLTSFPQFFNSMCGLWTVVLLLEITVYSAMAAVRAEIFKLPKRTSKQDEHTGETSGKTSAPIKAGIIAGTDTGITDVNASSVPRTGDKEAESNFPNTPRSNETPKARMTVTVLLLVLYVVCFLALPFLDLANSGWMESVGQTVTFLLGENSIVEGSGIIVLPLYALILLAIFSFGVLVLSILKYAVDRFLRKRANTPDFFSEYGTSVIVVCMVLPFLLSIRQVGSDGYELVNLVGSFFGYALGFLVGLIALMVVIEAIRLVRDQCMSHGTLLKISMRLIFVLIIQYSMGLLMGVLRIFALRSVLESLLLFFLPDLGESMEPEVTQVMNEALEREIERASSGLHGGYSRQERTWTRHKEKATVRRVGKQTKRNRRGAGWIKRKR